MLWMIFLQLWASLPSSLSKSLWRRETKGESKTSGHINERSAHKLESQESILLPGLPDINFLLIFLSLVLEKKKKL